MGFFRKKLSLPEAMAMAQRAVLRRDIGKSLAQVAGSGTVSDADVRSMAAELPKLELAVFLVLLSDAAQNLMSMEEFGQHFGFQFMMAVRETQPQNLGTAEGVIDDVMAFVSSASDKMGESSSPAAPLTFFLSRDYTARVLGSPNLTNEREQHRWFEVFNVAKQVVNAGETLMAMLLKEYKLVAE